MSTAITGELQEALYGLLCKGATRGEAARGVGVARDTFYRWLRQSAEFAAGVVDAEAAAAAARAEQALRPIRERQVS